MKMTEMNEYFEARGFDVCRKYFDDDKTLGLDGYYLFTISRGGRSISERYMWPADQKKFMDNMIRTFESVHENSMSVNEAVDYARSLECTVDITQEMRLEASTEITVEHYDDSITRNITNATPKSIAAEIIRMTNQITSSDTFYKDYVVRTLPLKGFTPVTIKNVIFNNPATIVFWSDGSKTVVKAQNDDEFDPEKGLAMAISKKALGNKGNYCNELKKWLPEYEPKISGEFNEFAAQLQRALYNTFMGNALED